MSSIPSTVSAGSPHYIKLATLISAWLAAFLLTPSLAHGTELQDQRLAPGITISVAPGTKMLKLGTRRLTLNGGKRVIAQVISLQAGSVEAFVEGHNALMVHAPNRINAICDGGQMMVARSNAATTVANIEGTTWLAGKKGLTEVAPGQARTWERGNGRNRTLLPAPSLEPERTLWVNMDGGADLSALTWKAIPDAARYELVASTQGRQIWSLQTNEPNLKQTQVKLTGGTHQLRLRGIDAQGIVGPWSEAAVIRVISVTLPEGAYVDAEGVVRLGEGQKLAFRHVEDVAITAGSHGQYRQLLPGEGVESQDGEVLRVYFRPKGGVRPEASIRVGRRQFSADVAIEPKGIAWPESPLLISVHVHGPDWLLPEASVLIGIDPVDVTWKRSGNLLSAVLTEAPDTAGPWVVRVRVEDQYGTFIAQDFRELAAPRRR